MFSSLGKGMFANVVRARVLQNEDGDSSGSKEVAIKIVRCQESMQANSIVYSITVVDESF